MVATVSKGGNFHGIVVDAARMDRRIFQSRPIHTLGLRHLEACMTVSVEDRFYLDVEIVQEFHAEGIARLGG